MLFNSFHFAYFFAIVFPTYWLLRNRLKAQNLLLLSAAYYFYGCWNWKFLSLLVISTAVDYCCGLLVERAEIPLKRKLYLALSMVVNLGMLGYFKYCNFFVDSLQELLARSGIETSLPTLSVLLPIGISFYTFQSMAYVIDVYRRDIPATKNFVQFATFVSFFPHLVAGPIMRPTILLPQVQNKRTFNVQQFYEGSYLIFWGLVKKVVVADNLALIANDLFGRWETIDGGLALLAVYAFAFQIYCDFSGYTDVARGVAKCLGFELALNFNLPYFATSPKDFWARWHISLSTWLRDYLYIPLGGNKGGKAVIVGNLLLATIIVGLGFGLYLTAEQTTTVAAWKVSVPNLTLFLSIGLLALFVLLVMIRGQRPMLFRNLMLTMIIGGLWHGAAWTFVAWGFYQGILLVGHRLAEPLLRRVQPKDGVDAACWKAVRIFVTFHLVCLGWLLFRAESMTQAWGMLSAILNDFAIPASAYLLPVLVVIIPLLIVQMAQYVSGDLNIIFRTPWYVRSVFYTLLFYAFVLGGEFGGGQFIYFQF
ncbi:MBOAT family protein [soil metagenome]